MAILFNDFNDQLFPEKKMDGIGICITLSPSFARESCVSERYLNFRKTTEQTRTELTYSGFFVRFLLGSENIT